MDDDALGDLQKQGKLVVFTSGANENDKMAEYSLYSQDKDNLYRCSLCEVDNYQEIFGLTDEEVEIVKAYMSTYEIIRQCCGRQMSKFERMRLGGCDMAPFFTSPAYPHCERYNLEEVEQALDHIPILHRVNSEDSNWARPGDCARFNDIVLKEHKYGSGSGRGCPKEP